MDLGKVGIWSGRLTRRPTPEALDLSAEWEQLGYGALWVPESPGGKDVLTFAAILLGATDRTYGEAGADLLFVEAPQSRDELARVGQELADWPLMANMVEFGKTPLVPVDELHSLGFSLVIFPGSITRTVTRGARDVLAELHKTGTTAGRLDDMASFSDVNQVVGLEAANEWEQAIADRSADRA